MPPISETDLFQIGRGGQARLGEREEVEEVLTLSENKSALQSM